MSLNYPYRPYGKRPCPRCGYCPHCGRGGHIFGGRTYSTNDTSEEDRLDLSDILDVDTSTTSNNTPHLSTRRTRQALGGER